MNILFLQGLYLNLYISFKQLNEQEALCNHSVCASGLQLFSLSVLEVHSTLNLLDPNKSAGLNQLDPYFLNKMLQQNC